MNDARDKFSNVVRVESPFMLADLSKSNSSVNALGFVFLDDKSFVYDDVYVETTFFNKGDNKNLIGVLCRASDKGFIEFRITPGGFYEIHRFDFELKKKNINPYVEILKGASLDIKTLTNWNTIGMNCTGSDFDFYINGKLQKFAIPVALKAEFGKLSEGNVGISVTNYPETTGAVEVHFDNVITEYKKLVNLKFF